jgi:hypothetical protein
LAGRRGSTEHASSNHDWLFGHFAYRSKAGVVDLSRNSVWGILSKAKGEPAGKSRICNVDWLPYKTSAALKKILKCLLFCLSFYCAKRLLDIICADSYVFLLLKCVFL